MNPLKLDYNNMLAPRLDGSGMDPDALEGKVAERFRAAWEDVEARRATGEMGFFDLPWASHTLEQVQELADGFGQWFENLVVLGIGGSALGTRMLGDALLGPWWNEGDGEAREHYPRLYVLENVDPDTVADLLARLDLRKTLFNVVSKSGSTAETMAQYLVVADLLRREVGEEKVRGHFLFTTDPDAGPLRQLADAEGIPSLPVPPNVGGRFSVFSPVGLLPAAVTGIDIHALLAGAATMEERCRTPELRQNPAGMVASLLHAADTEGGAPIHVLMPYADRLRTVGLWFQQLWAESLGKAVDRAGNPVHTGPTPLPALGATDQHSQIQLFMEGPPDKVVVFVAVAESPDPVEIPPLHPGIPALSYLGGHSLKELLDTERRATAEALRLRGRPNMTVEVERVSAHTLGELVMLFQIATVYAGALYDVDPLDQPGVELSKELTYGLLGREGHERPDIDPGDPRWTI
ncbi:MAG: glucose-6-phosphate isomerase [Gemmatimonadota bacterium]